MAKKTAAAECTKKTTQKPSSQGGKKVGPVVEVTRHIVEAVRCMLWGKAAGRCQFSGCNRILWKHHATQEQVNIAQAAHIYAFSVDGPRGHEGVDESALNDLDNLMLACHPCHKLMDEDGDGGQYSVALLQQWKAEHEKRVETVTGIDPKKSSHVILYGANIGVHSSPLSFGEAAHALFPDFYPAEDRAIELGTVNSSFQDRNPKFWQIEAEHLTTSFDRKVRQRIDTGELSHMSVFGLAPQPLLILLGTLMIDITRAEVYQRHREPRQTWDWPESAEPLQFEVQKPGSFDGPPALVLALTAPVTDDRITSVLGKGARIWKVSIPSPNNDHIKSRQDLSNFRKLVRPLLDEIKEAHGQMTPLHIFPVGSVSINIELGRIRMPKAHMPWVIYDQVNELGGFVPAINIPQQQGGA